MDDPRAKPNEEDDVLEGEPEVTHRRRSGAGREAAGSDDERLERLLDSFVERRLKGGHPSISEYAERAPELAEKIRELFPALELLGEARGGETAEAAPSPAHDPREPPQVLGDFRLIREVGRGGMGVVYEAEQTSLGRRVALKILPFHALTDEGDIERFGREARAAANLEHPGIVSVYGLGEDRGIHYYAMQFVAGESLDRILPEVRRLRSSSRAAVAEPRAKSASSTRSTAIALGLLSNRFDLPEAEEPPHSQTGSWNSPGVGPSPTPRPLVSVEENPEGYFLCAARVIRDVAEALAYAHDRCVLHRDVKPSNVILDMQGHAWVTDFGLAKAEGESGLTKTGELVGTLRYMAPERFQGECDARSDVYSLGLTLYEVLTTEPAFSGSDRAQLYKSVTERTPRRPRELEPRIPRELERIVLKSIQRVPDQRYQSSLEMAEDLARYLEGRPVLARLPGPAHSVRTFWRRRRVAISVLVLLALAVAGTCSWWQAVHRPIEVQHLLARDLDGDGDADLLTANAGSQSVTILLNSGDGSFSVAGHVEVGEVPVCVAAADLNGNGAIDLATANFRAATVSVLLNVGENRYSRIADIDIGLPVNFVLSADLDRDGDNDLVVTASGKNAYILKNRGDASFAELVSLETLIAPNIAAAVDLDGDAALDLVMGYNPPDVAPGDPSTNHISVFHNEGDGAFGKPANYRLAMRPWGFVAADLDGDGDPDLVLAHAFQIGFEILLNEGDGTFAEEGREFPTRSPIQSIASEDFNSDGRVDLVVAGDVDYVAVLLGKGDGTFSSPVELSGAENPSCVDAADVDGDEDPDLIVAEYNRSSRVTLFLNDGAGRFGEHRAVPLWSWWKFLSKTK